jgi:hypothetical protein
LPNTTNQKRDSRVAFLQGVFVQPPAVSCVDGQWQVELPPAVASVTNERNAPAVHHFKTRDDLFLAHRDASPLARQYEAYVNAVLEGADAEADGMVLMVTCDKC